MDEIAHSFKCIIPEININNQEVLAALKLSGPSKVSYSFFVNNIYLFSPLMAELLEFDPNNWNAKQKDLNRIAIELHTIGQYQYARSLKLIPSDNENNEWLSPWDIIELETPNNNQVELLIQLEKISNLEFINDEMIFTYFSVLENFNDTINYSKIKREVNNNHIKFFSKSLVLYLLAFIMLGLSWIFKPILFRKNN